jgi:hypothetical protein
MWLSSVWRAVGFKKVNHYVCMKIIKNAVIECATSCLSAHRAMNRLELTLFSEACHDVMGWSWKRRF